jgi:hypothetical protein
MNDPIRTQQRFRRGHRRGERLGFTLLELLLTLSMTVVLMTLVNAAFDFYAFDMDSSDADMRRTMLASAVMQMIEDDLRASLHPEPLDTAALEELLSSTAGAASGLSGGGGGGAGDDSGDAAAAGLDDPSIEEDTSSIETGTTVLLSPGLIGNQFQLQIDTSRLPRLEEYSVMMDVDPGNLNDLPSDLKTVTYFVQQAEAYGVDDPLAKLDDSTSTGSGGLVRRVLDRQASTFAALSGNINSLNQTGELLAPEVMGIEFSYWDGMIWQIQWNSDELGELPLAVKIQMSMVDPLVDANEQVPRLFSHVVRLPMAKIIEEEEDEELAEAGL